jgi:hypothetical protein
MAALLPRLALALPALLIGCWTTSCAPSAPEPVLPEGTVMTLDGIAITAAEVDAIADTVAQIDPAYTTPHCRRVALTTVLFPKTFGQELAPEERARAQEEAEAWDAARREGSLTGPLEPPVLGTWEDLGIDLWDSLRELEVGAWSGVIELSGRFAVVQLLDRDHDVRPGQELFEVQLKSFPYVMPPSSLSELCLEAKLEILDPEWEPIVPGFWKYKMRGDS